MGRAPIVIEAGDAPHAPTEEIREQVRMMVACDLDVAQMCHILRITPFELKRCYGFELENGLHLVNAGVKMRMLKAIEAGDMISAQYWLKSKAKQIVPTKIEGEVQVTHDMKIKRGLMDEIVEIMTGPRRKEAEAAANAKTAAAGPSGVGNRPRSH